MPTAYSNANYRVFCYLETNPACNTVVRILQCLCTLGHRYEKESSAMDRDRESGPRGAVEVSQGKSRNRGRGHGPSGCKASQCRRCLHISSALKVFEKLGSEASSDTMLYAWEVSL